MSRVMAAGGTAKLRQKISTSAAVIRATSSREGAFSSRLMVGCEHSARPLSGDWPTASLNKGSVRRVSQSSASSYPQAIANMRKRSIAGSVWTTSAGSPPVPDAARQPLGQPEPAFGAAQQTSPPSDEISPPSDEISPPSKSAVNFLRLTAWEDRTGEGYLRSWWASRFRCLGKNAIGTEFLPDLNGLRHVRHHIVAAP